MAKNPSGKAWSSSLPCSRAAAGAVTASLPCLGLGIGGCEEPLASSGLSFVLFCSEVQEFCSVWKCFTFVEHGTITLSRCTHVESSSPCSLWKFPSPNLGSAVPGGKGRTGKGEAQVGFLNPNNFSWQHWSHPPSCLWWHRWRSQTCPGAWFNAALILNLPQGKAEETLILFLTMSTSFPIGKGTICPGTEGAQPDLSSTERQHPPEYNQMCKEHTTFRG